MIVNCTCKHEYQDNKHGKDKCVFNERLNKGNKDTKLRCTVCLAEKTIYDRP